MTRTRTLVAALVVALAIGAPAMAQRGTGVQPVARGQGASGQAQERQPGDRPNREQLERQIRENFTRRVQADLRLNDEDMTKLAAVNRRFDAERRRLVQEERQVRVALRSELDAPEGTANQTRVGELLDQMLRITRTRLNLVEQEQRELSAFMTPVQRARYQGMVESLQRRMDDLMDGRGRGGRGDGRGDGRLGGRGGPPRGAGVGRGAVPPPATNPPPPASVQRTPPPR